MTHARGVQGQLLKSVYVETGYNLDPTSMVAQKLPFNTQELKGDQNLVTAATIRGRRDPAEPILGNVNVAGAVTVPVDRFNIGHWLYMALGGYAVASTGGDLFEHTFSVSSVLDSHVLETGYLDIAAYQKFNGCKVGGFSLRVGGDEELTMSFDVIGGKETLLTASAFSGTPAERTLGRYKQFDASLQEGGSAIATVTELEFTFNNNLDDSVYLIDGTEYRGDLPEGFATVEGMFRAKFENWSLYAYAMSGTERSLQIDFAVGSDQLQISIDELIYKRMSPGIPSAEGIWIEMPFQAYYSNAAAASVIRAILTNSLNENTYIGSM
jgi:hypothetical protein